MSENSEAECGRLQRTDRLAPSRQSKERISGSRGYRNQRLIVQMKPIERRRTSAKAVDKINEYLHRRDYASAVFLSSIYVHIRLKSLLSDKLARRHKEKWEAVFTELNELKLGFSLALRMCKAAGMISSERFREMKQLWKKRNSLAHESTLWRDMGTEDVSEIDRLCKCAEGFLEETSGTD